MNNLLQKPKNGNKRFLHTRKLLLAGALIVISAITLLPASASARDRALILDFYDKFETAEPYNVFDSGVRVGRLFYSGDERRWAIFLHPPILEKGETGKAVLKYSKIELPEISEGEVLCISFGLGICNHANLQDPEHPADGIIFALTVEGVEVFRKKHALQEWSDEVVDISEFAGRTVDISIITEPGENSNYDWALWSRPRLWRMSKKSYTERVFTSPATLELLSFGPARGLVFSGEKINFLGHLKNIGEEKIEDNIQVSLYLAGKERTREIKLPLEGGEKKEISWGEIEPLNPGKYEFKVSIETKYQRLQKEGEFFVYSPYPRLRDIPGDRARIYEAQDSLILENEKLRLVIPKTEYGHSFGLIYYWRGSHWELAGVKYPLSEIVFQLGQGREEQSIQIHAQEYNILEPGPEIATLELVANYQDRENVNWHVKIRFSLAEKEHRVSLTHTLSVGQDRELLYFSGPRLLVGERIFGEEKDFALFPGLEFLEKDEMSSSTRDAHPPFSHRWMPDPYKITVPLMAISKDECLVGLFWNPLNLWDGDNHLYGARFSSPNWLESQENHLLELFLPPVPDWVRENEWLPRAYRAYNLKPNRPISIESKLVVKYPAGIVEAAPEWVEIYGLPSPSPQLRTWEEEIALSRHAFFYILWDETVPGWSHVVGWPIAPSPGFSYLLWLDSMFTPCERTRAELRRRVGLVTEAILDRHGPEGLASRELCHILFEQFPFHYGYLEPAILGLEGGLWEIINRQGADGSWGGFRPPPGDEKRAKLGPHGKAVVGTEVYYAMRLLRYARITGSKRHLESGLKGLEFINSLAIPRGSQVWEVPLFAPDVLASALAMAGNIEAYRILGEEKYLKQAVYWAKAGLPFIYLWKEEHIPLMLYSSIPVFGTSFFIHPWFGVPVQWNGLVYAYHLQKLAEFDRSFPWKEIARGITIAGQYHTFLDEELKGCYTDAVLDRFTRFDRWLVLNPENKLLNTYRLKGFDPDISTRIISLDSSRIHVSSGGEVQKANLEGSNLTLTLEYFPGESCFTLIAGLTKPISVIKDNRELLFADNLEAVEEGWNYNEERGFVFLKTRFEETKINLVINDVQALSPDQLIIKPLWDFDEDSNTEGWRGVQHFAPLTVVDGVLKSSVTGFDPYLVGPAISADANKLKRIEMRLKVSGGERGAIYFRSSESPEWAAPPKYVSFRLNPDNQFHTYVIDMSKHRSWQGNIFQVRLDIEPPDVPKGTQVEIDYIRWIK